MRRIHRRALCRSQTDDCRMRSSVIFEEHSAVLAHWIARGIRAATVVTLDAHLDLQFIGTARLERLRACGGDAAAVARLGSTQPLSPNRDACYGIEDFLYAAARLGVVRRLVWVAPPHVLREADAALDALRQMEGVTPQDIASFRTVPGGWVEGRVLGVPLAAVAWQQLPAVALEGPVVLDIDADYFTQVPQDRVWVDPRPVVQALGRVAGAHSELTISRSVGSGFMPLEHRFIADHLAALWEGRERELEDDRCLLEAAMEPPDSSRRLSILRRCVDAISRKPEQGSFAACLYALAQASPPQERDGLITQAAEFDPHYRPDLLREAGRLWARRPAIDYASVMRLQNREQEWSASADRKAALWVALGLLHATFGKREEAIACAAASRCDGRTHPDLSLQIGLLYIEAGRSNEARPWLEAAAEDDETRVIAWLLLSRCASETGQLERAEAWARLAADAAPAWEAAQRTVAAFAP
jgi:hypothetical protein